MPFCSAFTCYAFCTWLKVYALPFILSLRYNLRLRPPFCVTLPHLLGLVLCKLFCLNTVSCCPGCAFWFAPIKLGFCTGLSGVLSLGCYWSGLCSRFCLLRSKLSYLLLCIARLGLCTGLRCNRSHWHKLCPLAAV